MTSAEYQGCRLSLSPRPLGPRVWMPTAILYSSHSLSRLSKLLGAGSALRHLTPRALANSKIFLLASWLAVKFCTPNAAGVTPYCRHALRTARICSGVLLGLTCLL